MTGPAASLAGRTALVTGVATGIGQAIALAPTAAGARAAVNHNHTPRLEGHHASGPQRVHLLG